MKFISVQPDSDFYLWQLKVQMSNFKRFGIEQDTIIILGYRGNINPNSISFLKSTNARVEFIEDSRRNIGYIPSLRPHLLKKFYKFNQISEPIFYHDADMIFTGALPDINSMSEPKVYVSDTVSYIGSNYIKSKGQQLFMDMCKIVGIDPSTAEEREQHSGGAQYLFNIPLDYDFWAKVETDCEELYKLMTSTSHIYSPQHPIQAWTADMWAVLWNIWLRGSETEVHKELDFCWPTDFIQSWNQVKIFHNAGVDGSRPELFYKARYISEPPFSVDLNSYSDKYCSFNYVKEIKNGVI